MEIDLSSKGIKSFIWWYHFDDDVKVIESLVSEGVLSVEIWFGNHTKMQHNIKPLLFQPEFILKEENLLLLPLEYDEKIRDYYEKFVEGYSRKPYSKGQSHHELWHLFYLYARYFFTQLKVKKIEVVLFSVLPHHGIDMLLYGMAKVMGIRTILTMQSLVPNRFWYIEDIEDFGYFSQIPIREDKAYKIPNSFKKELFYMKNISYKKPSCFVLAYKDFERGFLGKASKKIRLSGIVSKFTACRFYYRYRMKAFVKSVDLKRKYIYFPLQLQPELTTSTLGGKYVDQLLALEHLAKIIPEDWFIYIKENPKQMFDQRDRCFFKRLERIPSVRYLSMKYNTYELIESSQFVSVVTGTAGWEAISGGKNVLVFGQAWYKTLPGVFSFHSKMNIEEILAYKIDHTLLEREYSKLIGKSYEGIIDKAYYKSDITYKSQKNIEHLRFFLKDVLHSKCKIK